MIQKIVMTINAELLSLPQLLRFSLEILNAHDHLRALHEVGPVKLSEKVLNRIGLNCILSVLTVLWPLRHVFKYTHEIKIS